MALRSPIDIDGDGAGDTVIAAVDSPSLAALDAKGQLLWARRYQVDLPRRPQGPFGKTPQQQELKLQGIMDLQAIGDRDGDGTHDLLATVVEIFPGVRNDTALVILSGKTGEPVHVFDAHSINVVSARQWPTDGVFATYHSNRRQHSMLRFTRDGVSQNQSYTQPPAIQFGRSSEQAFAVPSPLQLVEIKGQPVAIQLIGDVCYGWDLESRQAAFPSFKLPFYPAKSPLLARCKDDQHVLLFYDLSGQKGQRGLSAYALDGTELWSQKPVDNVYWNLIGTRNHVDWPLVADCDGDQVDEILMPTSGRFRWNDIGLDLLDPSTGKTRWYTLSRRNLQFHQPSSRFISRMGLSSDIDGDGIRDWVTASISGPPNELSGRKEVLIGKAYVYIDWFSGRTGEPLAWSRQLIPQYSDRIEVAEIEAVRCDIPGSDTGIVEVELVTGDTLDDDQLQGMVMRFHPSQKQPLEIASGLTVCNSGPPTGDGGTRVYQFRSGPFADGPSSLMILKKPEPEFLRAGENEPIAAWETPDGRSLLAIKGFEPARLSVIDAKTLKTVWMTQREAGQDVQIRKLDRGNGDIDFLIQPDSRQNNPGVLFDGETGEELWTMTGQPGGRILVARRVDNNRLLVIGNGHYTVQFGQSEDAFTLSMVNIRTGAMLWSKRFLHFAARHNYPDTMGADEFAVADLNGDGQADIIGPDQEKDERLLLAAWDGTTGERIWKINLGYPGQRSDYYVRHKLIMVRDQSPDATSVNHPMIVVAGRDQDEESAEHGLLLCNARTGKQVAFASLFPENQAGMIVVDRDYPQKSLSISDCSDEQPQVGVSHFMGTRGRIQSEVFAVTMHELTRISSHQRDDKGPSGTIRDDTLWSHDLEGDGTDEQLISRRIASKTKRDAAGNVVNLPSQMLLECYSSDGNTLRWSLDYYDRVGRYAQIRNIHWQPLDDRTLAILDLWDDRFLVIDATAGRIISDLQQNVSGQPLIVATRKTDGLAEEFLVGKPDADGMVFQWSGTNPSPLASSPGWNQQYAIGELSDGLNTDPRRRKRFITIGESDPNIVVTQMIQSSIAAGVLLVLPLAYLGTMFRRRQWGLSWLLLAPMIVLMMMTVATGEWIKELGVPFHVISGIGWISGFSALYVAMTQREKTDPFKGRSWGLLFVLTVSITSIMLGFMYGQAIDRSAHYYVSAMDLAMLVFASMMTAGHCYWVLRFLRSGWLRLTSRQSAAA